MRATCAVLVKTKNRLMLSLNIHLTKLLENVLFFSLIDQGLLTPAQNDIRMHPDQYVSVSMYNA